MRIQIYRDIVEVESLESTITFRTGGPRENFDRKNTHSLRMFEPLMSYGFSGTVRDALEKYPDVVKIVED